MAQLRHIEQAWQEAAAVLALAVVEQFVEVALRMTPVPVPASYSSSSSRARYTCICVLPHPVNSRTSRRVKHAAGAVLLCTRL